ncbi:ferro-O2-oxidoreductase [Cordyceps fumosorosea ARSEF 2679]|uniref:Ferro-O2-oxidoreductase n=1 Tax=Cordyceps fumosorosea (strain ARSEF 2679) TaxID=1081104 RepID=A0A167LPH1_CORFA|nr:ferro-O2-oxidoreductase [Cordyceps fumosorosea ARSEF 2679]OAA53334.1 ferro-O2-oxidoreductase [Cordyceps fumosorosea ARSEF 2679]
MPAQSGKRSLGTRMSLWLATAVFFCAATLLVGPYLGRQPQRLVHQQSKPRDEVAIPLHPQLHNNRDAKTLHFDWTVTSGLRSPDGVEKRVYLVNGEFPGPTIEARSGDRVIVHVRNHLADEGLSIHWHGLRLRGNNTMDGAVGITQCPIPSGRDFVYDFNIGPDEHGTFWWHSHHKVQRGDGLFGGLVVHPPQQHVKPHDYDDVLLMIGDWFHQPQADVLEWYASWTSLGDEPVPDSLQINGHGRFDCAMEMPAFPINCTDRAVTDMTPIFRRKAAQTRLRLVNVGTISGLSLMVDGATLEPIQVDGGCAVQSSAADAIGVLYPGERTDLMLSWKEGSESQPWLNIYLDDENYSRPNPSLIEEQAFPALPDTLLAANFQPPRALAAVQTHISLDKLASDAPTKTGLPPAQQTILFYLKTMIKSHLGNRPHGYVNHTTWKPQSKPILSQSRQDWDDNQFFPYLQSGPDPVHVDLVINNLDDGSHPMHLHGHSFYVLSSFRAEGRAGWGSYNPFDPGRILPRPLNLANPLVKDTVSVPRRGHVVLRVLVDNPGLWMLHCHMMVHMGTGMAAGFHVGPADDEQHTLALSSAAADVCETS